MNEQSKVSQVIRSRSGWRAEYLSEYTAQGCGGIPIDVDGMRG